MHSPNDVVGVGPRSFYATNDRGYEKGLLATLEAWLALPFSSLVYYDGQSGGYAASGLTYANGVNVSADGETLYVSELLRRRIRLFDRDAETGALKKGKAIRVNTAPDNIEVAADGALWIGGHSKIFDFLKHVEDPAAIAPSHVIRVNPETGLVDDILYDGQGAINASSVAAASGETLIVGSVFDDHVMLCPNR